MQPEINWGNNLYGKVISRAAELCSDKFAALASPTFSKQEAITHLAESIKAGIGEGQRNPHFPWCQVVEFIPRLILMFARVSYAAMRFRTRRIPEGAVYFRTWLVPSSFLRGALVDDYFRQLPEDLAVHEKVVVSFTSTDVGLLNHFGRMRRDDCQIISYGLLSLLDVLKLFWDYVSTALIKTQQKYILGGSDVTAYINHSLLLDYLGLRSFEAYAEKIQVPKTHPTQHQSLRVCVRKPVVGKGLLRNAAQSRHSTDRLSEQRLLTDIPEFLSDRGRRPATPHARHSVDGG